MLPQPAPHGWRSSGADTVSKARGRVSIRYSHGPLQLPRIAHTMVANKTRFHRNKLWTSCKTKDRNLLHRDHIRRKTCSSGPSKQFQHVVPFPLQPIIPTYAEDGAVSARTKWSSLDIHNRLACGSFTGCLTDAFLVIWNDPLPADDPFQGKAQPLCRQDTWLVYAESLPLHPSQMQITVGRRIQEMLQEKTGSNRVDKGAVELGQNHNVAEFNAAILYAGVDEACHASKGAVSHIIFQYLFVFRCSLGYPSSFQANGEDHSSRIASDVLVMPGLVHLNRLKRAIRHEPPKLWRFGA